MITGILTCYVFFSELVLELQAALVGLPTVWWV